MTLKEVVKAKAEEFKNKYHKRVRLDYIFEYLDYSRMSLYHEYINERAFNKMKAKIENIDIDKLAKFLVNKLKKDFSL